MLIHRTPPFVKHNWNVEIKVLQYCLKVIRIFSFLTELPFLSLFPFYFISLFIFLAFCETNQQSHDKSDLIVLKDSFFNGMGKIRGRLGFFPPRFIFFLPHSCSRSQVESWAELLFPVLAAAHLLGNLRLGYGGDSPSDRCLYAFWATFCH